MPTAYQLFLWSKCASPGRKIRADKTLRANISTSVAPPSWEVFLRLLGGKGPESISFWASSSHLKRIPITPEGGEGNRRRRRVALYHPFCRLVVYGLTLSSRLQAIGSRFNDLRKSRPLDRFDLLSLDSAGYSTYVNTTHSTSLGHSATSGFRAAGDRNYLRAWFTRPMGA